jgi:KaiC/GvpD/RAD55 family RecA-like ATPase
LTVVVGATGIGKTQLGIQFANAGQRQEARRGIVFDMTSRGDSQSHGEYARRMFDWSLEAADASAPPQLDDFFNSHRKHGDYLHVFDHHGRRVTRRDIEFENWQDWQAELARKLTASIAFFYGNFVQGVRRAVIDGVEPAERASESIQCELFEYVYHQILRKDSEWVARDLFRERYRAHAEEAAQARYETSQVACLLLYTSAESLLDNLIARPLDEGDMLANANTLLYFGKVRDGVKMRRALYVAKHRGSACTDEIAFYTIDDQGLRLE